MNEVSLKEPKCLSCKHYIISEGYIPICKAFPKRIPREIFADEIEHDKPYEGDHGIQYEQKE